MSETEECETWRIEHPLPSELTIGRIQCGVEPKEPRKPTPPYGPVADVVGKWAFRDLESSSDPLDRTFTSNPCFIMDVLPEEKKMVVTDLDFTELLHHKHPAAFGPPYFHDKWREATPQELDINFNQYLYTDPEDIEKKVLEMKETYRQTGEYNDCLSTSSSGEGESETPECSDGEEEDRISSMTPSQYSHYLHTCTEFARQTTRQLNPERGFFFMDKK